jgi:hypothetical protein
MRKLLAIVLLLFVLVIGGAALWIFKGPRISLFVDRHGIAEDSSEQIKSVRYEGNGTAGLLYVNQISLSLNETVPPLQLPSVGSTKDGKQLGLASGGKVFPMGPMPEIDSPGETIATAPDQGDDARISLSHSRLPWPTPFEVNFMTGSVTSWRRHTYQRLTWVKPNGSKLDMLWRYEQFFYKGNGWASPTMTHEGETGLIKIEIKP